jgi:CheY-like chemotaxis protein
MQTCDLTGTTVTLQLRPFKNPGNVLAASAAQHPDASTMPTALAKSSGLDNLCVLVVDDDDYNRTVLCGQFPAGITQVETAVNGRYALERVMARRPDVVFMDIEMPVMGGIEAMHNVRAYQQAKGQKPSLIVAFSAHDDVDSQARFLALGFDRCMSKPTSAPFVHALLKSLPRVDDEAQTEALTVKVEAVLLPTIPAFLASRLQLVEQLALATDNPDREPLRRLAHKLSGSLAMYGFAWAAALCSEIEEHASTMEPAAVALHALELTQHLRTVRVIPATNI